MEPDYREMEEPIQEPLSPRKVKTTNYSKSISTTVTAEKKRRARLGKPTLPPHASIKGYIGENQDKATSVKQKWNNNN